ncbi:large repetitive protein [Staphylococcus schleiferi]
MNRKYHLKSEKQVQQQFGIRKYKVGIVSVMFASFIYINIGHSAQAAELPASHESGSSITHSNVNTVEKKEVPEAGEHTALKSEDSVDATTVTHVESAVNKDKVINHTQAEQPTNADTATRDTTAKAPQSDKQDAEIGQQTGETTFRAADSSVPEANEADIHAPAPQAQAQPKTVEKIPEKVYEKSIPVMKHPKNAQTLGMGRGIGQGRESLGVIVPAHTKLYIRQVHPQNNDELHVSLMTDDSQQNKSKVIPKTGEWVSVEAAIDSAAFVNLPRGLNHQPLVDFYIQNNLGRALPTYRRGQSQSDFEAQWEKQDASYAFVEGEHISFLIPKEDRQRISKMKQSQGSAFKNLDEMIDYYDDVISKYSQWAGLNEDPQSPNYNVEMKYFTMADKNGYGLAYWTWDHMGSNSASLHGYLQPGWLALHEVGHGYDGWMVGDSRMELLEVWNNIFANEYQTKVQGIKNGWLYENRQQAFQQRIHDQILKNPQQFSYANIGLRDRLDFMTRMVRLTGIEGLTQMLQSVREEASQGPVTKDVPRWINTYWLANHGYNGLAYFDLYHIDIPTSLKDTVNAYPNSYIYPLALLIENETERQKYVKQLGLSTAYELVRSSDLKESTIKASATVTVDQQGQVLPDGSTIKLIDGTTQVAEATIVNGKAQFEQIRPGIYKIVAPLSKDAALPEHAYLIVKEKGENVATVTYPALQHRQTAMTERIVLQGISNREFVNIEYQPEHQKVIYRQNNVQPHFYFTDEYAHITIKNQNGKILLDQSLIGKETAEGKVATFDLKDGDTITVKHREPQSRRQVWRIENHTQLKLPQPEKETVTYTLTDKGFIVEGETTEAAEKRYAEQMQEDVTQLIQRLKAEPNRDYRIPLYRIVQGVQHMDVIEKEKLMQQLQPYLQEMVTNHTEQPTVSSTERDKGFITGDASENAWVTVTYPSGTMTKVQADEYGYWETAIPEREALQVNDQLAIVATLPGKFPSPPLYVKVTDTIAPPPPQVDDFVENTSTMTGTSALHTTILVTLPNKKTLQTNTVEGKWSIEIPPSTPQTADDTIFVQAIDDVGNRSAINYVTPIDNTPPVQPQVTVTEAGKHIIWGHGEKYKDTIEVTLPNNEIIKTKVGRNLTWMIGVPFHTELRAGSKISVIEIDCSGNRSQPGIGQVVDTTPPQTPTVDLLQQGTPVLTGKAEPKSKIIVTINEKTMLEAQVHQDGTWEINNPAIATIQADDNVSVKAVDESANVSPLIFVKVQPMTKAPETIESVKDSETSAHTNASETPSVPVETPEVMEQPKTENNVEATETEETPEKEVPVETEVASGPVESPEMVEESKAEDKVESTEEAEMPEEPTVKEETPTVVALAESIDVPKVENPSTSEESSEASSVVEPPKTEGNTEPTKTGEAPEKEMPVETEIASGPVETPEIVEEPKAENKVEPTEEVDKLEKPTVKEETPTVVTPADIVETPETEEPVEVEERPQTDDNVVVIEEDDVTEESTLTEATRPSEEDILETISPSQVENTIGHIEELEKTTPVEHDSPTEAEITVENDKVSEAQEIEENSTTLEKPESQDGPMIEEMDYQNQYNEQNGDAKVQFVKAKTNVTHDYKAPEVTKTHLTLTRKTVPVAHVSVSDEKQRLSTASQLPAAGQSENIQWKGLLLACVGLSLMTRRFFKTHSKQ